MRKRSHSSGATMSYQCADDASPCSARTGGPSPPQSRYRNRRPAMVAWEGVGAGWSMGFNPAQSPGNRGYRRAYGARPIRRFDVGRPEIGSSYAWRKTTAFAPGREHLELVARAEMSPAALVWYKLKVVLANCTGLVKLRNQLGVGELGGSTLDWIPALYRRPSSLNAGNTALKCFICTGELIRVRAIDRAACVALPQAVQPPSWHNMKVLLAICTTSG